MARMFFMLLDRDGRAMLPRWVKGLGLRREADEFVLECEEHAPALRDIAWDTGAVGKGVVLATDDGGASLHQYVLTNPRIAWTTAAPAA